MDTATEAQQLPAVLPPAAPESPPKTKERKDQLVRLGVSKDVARRILASVDDADWMNQKVTLRLNMTFLVNSLQQMGRVQHAMRKLSMSKDVAVTPRDRVNAAAVVAQMGQAIARTSEANVSNSTRLDDPDRDADKRQPSQNNVFFGFPPVAQPRLPATTGETTNVEVVPAVKTP